MPHTPFSLMPCCDHAWMRESCAKEAVRCRRVSPFYFVALLLMLWAAPRSSDAADVAPTASGQPHIVMFVSDGHGYLDSPVYNPASRIRTPNLLRLSQLGTTYTHAFFILSEPPRKSVEPAYRYDADRAHARSRLPHRRLAIAPAILVVPFEGAGIPIDHGWRRAPGRCSTVSF
jgi:hypothetical protein